MTLHILAIHDDDWTSTAADIAAADFVDGENIVQTRDGEVPILRGIHMNSGALTAVSSRAYQDGAQARMTLMPSTWKETHKIFHEMDLFAIPIQDGITATDFNNSILQPIDLNDWGSEPYNIQLTENMNWINAGDSQIIGPLATVTNITVLLVYQYGPVVPWDGRNHPVVVVRKLATADVTADLWSTVANELFTDDGLDPDAIYRPLWGYCYPEAALDSVTMAWRMTDVDHKTFIGGLGPGSCFGARVRTWFRNDSMLINGDSNIKMEALGDAAHKPTVVVAFEEMFKGAEPRTVAPAATPMRASGPSASRLQLPQMPSRPTRRVS